MLIRKSKQKCPMCNKGILMQWPNKHELLGCSECNSIFWNAKYRSQETITHFKKELEVGRR